MNTNNIDHMIAVLTAYKEGKTIQSRKRRHRDWRISTGGYFLWDFFTYEYRVKPEPRTIWVPILPEGQMGTCYAPSQESASNNFPWAHSFAKFVEVIEE